MSKSRHITAFYAPPEAVTDDRIVLPADEADHARRVLRLKDGAKITVVDGAGGWYAAVLSEEGKRGVSAKIIDARQRVGEPRFRLVVAIGLLKSKSRFEVFVEKAVELGVSAIIPMITDRSENTSVNARRCKAIALAAMKQAGRSTMVEIESPISFDEVLSRTEKIFVCHEKERATASLLSAVGNLSGGDAVLVAIGPEGGFSDGEIATARTHGCTIASLGERRLRAETAAIAAVTLVSMAHPSEIRN